MKIVCIRSFSGPHSVRMLENTEQKNSEYGPFYAVAETADVQISMWLFLKPASLECCTKMEE